LSQEKMVVFEKGHNDRNGNLSTGPGPAKELRSQLPEASQLEHARGSQTVGLVLPASWGRRKDSFG